MKTFFPPLFVLSFLALIACSHSSNSALSSQRSFKISSQVYDAVPFLPHRGYLAMNIAFEPVKDLFEDIEEQTGLSLISRGEAHITVLTPKEYSALAEVLDPAEIDGIADRSRIQSSVFEIVCVGQGSQGRESGSDSTFFIVVTSPDLLDLRQTILDEYSEQGGKGFPFVATHYYPHITVGFTKTDLHEEQGVVKDQSSCIGKLEEVP